MHQQRLRLVASEARRPLRVALARQVPRQHSAAHPLPAASARLQHLHLAALARLPHLLLAALVPLQHLPLAALVPRSLYRHHRSLPLLVLLLPLGLEAVVSDLLSRPHLQPLPPPPPQLHFLSEVEAWLRLLPMCPKPGTMQRAVGAATLGTPVSASWEEGHRQRYHLQLHRQPPPHPRPPPSTTKALPPCRIRPTPAYLLGSSAPSFLARPPSLLRQLWVVRRYRTATRIALYARQVACSRFVDHSGNTGSYLVFSGV